MLKIRQFLMARIFLKILRRLMALFHYRNYLFEQAILTLPLTKRPLSRTFMTFLTLWGISIILCLGGRPAAGQTSDQAALDRRVVGFLEEARNTWSDWNVPHVLWGHDPHIQKFLNQVKRNPAFRTSIEKGSGEGLSVSCRMESNIIPSR
jgi:hypothetical protein